MPWSGAIGLSKVGSGSSKLHNGPAQLLPRKGFDRARRKEEEETTEPSLRAV
jgi:hypothetical protein